MEAPSGPIALTRDCQAVEVPSGEMMTLSAGTEVTITQTLGGDYTVMVGWGRLARIAGPDADALGMQPAATTSASDAAGADKPLEERVWETLRSCFDPEIPVNIVDLGLVYHCAVEPSEEGGHRIAIKMTLTAPGCGMADVLRADVQRKLLSLRGVRNVDVDIVFDPPWDRHKMSDAAKLQLGMFD